MFSIKNKVVISQIPRFSTHQDLSDSFQSVVQSREISF
jgi:hypothetical protein